MACAGRRGAGLIARWSEQQMRRYGMGVGLGIAVVAMAGSACGQESPINDIKQAAAGAKITLAQVIEIAEKEIAGG